MLCFQCRKKQDFVDKSSQLQRALSSLQLSNDKREQSDKKARTQLEGEITDLKLRLASMNANNGNPNVNFNPSQSTQQQQQPRTLPNQSQLQNARAFQSPQTIQPQPPPYVPPGSKYEINTNESQQQLMNLQEKLRASEEQIHHLNSQVSKWEHALSPEALGGGGMYGSNSSGGKQSMSASTPNTPNSWTNSNSRGGTPHFFGNNSDKLSTEELHSLSQTQNRATDLEWKIKDLESRLVERDAMIRVLQTGPSSPVLFSSSLNSSNSSSVPALSQPLPSYRESPSYSQASTSGAGYTSPTLQLQGSNGQHANQISLSLASMMEQQQYGQAPNQAAALALYSKAMSQKCESEPPSYANIPIKLRLGGSGSSLVKNSNESLQLAGGGSLSTGGNSPSTSGPGSVSSTSGTCGNGTKSIDDQLKELNNQLLSKVKEHDTLLMF